MVSKADKWMARMYGLSVDVELLKSLSDEMAVVDVPGKKADADYQQFNRMPKNRHLKSPK